MTGIFGAVFDLRLSARMPVSRARPLSWLLALLAVAIAIAATPAPIEAHAQLLRSDPPVDSMLAAPPREINLWMTEAVATGEGSPGLQVLDETGKALNVTSVKVDPADPTHIIGEVDGIGFGTFTVIWVDRSADDGHTLSGTFAFRVGGTNRAPGAATVEGEKPRVWAVATRWLTFLGAAVAAAGLFGGLLLGEGAETDRGRRRFAMAAVTAAIGVIATISEPFLQARFPGAGSERSSAGDALAALPNAWWLRAPLLTVACILAIVAFLGLNRRHVAPAAGVASLIGILGLSLTSHVAARESLRPLGIASVALHEWSVALWVGGLIVMGAVWRNLVDSSASIRRFSFAALPLALLGIATGVLNAGLDLPSLSSLWSSDFGRVIIIKVAILIPVLGLATYHRLTLRRVAVAIGAGLRSTVRIEAALAIFVILCGSILVLLAPPTGKATGTAISVDLAAPLAGSGAADNLYVRFTIAPAKPGDNTIDLIVTQGVPVSVGSEGGLIDAPPLAGITLVRLNLTSLDHPGAALEVPLTLGPNNHFTAAGGQFSLDGWWETDVLVRRPGVEDATATFYLLLPDPNVNGFNAPPTRPSDANGEAQFQRGLHGLTSAHSIQYIERLGGGTGTVVTSTFLISDGTDGHPAALHIISNQTEMIRSGGFQWLRTNGGEWQKTDSPGVVPPSQFGTDYDGATGFHLGPVQTAGGEQAQVVSFYVPGTPSLAPAWYIWWVGVDSGRLLREAMISRGHYMQKEFSRYDEELDIQIPGEPGS